MARFKFKLVRGTHVDNSGTYEPGKGRKSIIDTDEDLAARFGADRFRLLDDSGEESRSVEDEEENAAESTGNEWADSKRAELAEMTVVDLREFAEQEEIDLEGASKKDEIINKIVQALAAR